MDEQLHEHAEPQQPEPDPDGAETRASTPAPATPPWRRRPAQIAAVAVLAMAGAGIGFAVSDSGPGQISVHGTLQLSPLAAVDSTDFEHAANGDACEAGQGYSDITSGATVVVGGSTGQTLGIGALSAGVETNVDSSLGLAMGFCVFSFDVPVPAGQSAYTVTISHRGTQTFTPAQVAAGIELTLGQ